MTTVEFELIKSPDGEPAARRGRGRARASTVARLLGQALTVAAGVVVITFLLVRMVPGDPTTVILGSTATPQARDALRSELHLNGSLLHQFGGYVGQLLHGDLGSSAVSPAITVTSLLRDA